MPALNEVSNPVERGWTASIGNEDDLHLGSEISGKGISILIFDSRFGM